MARRGYSLLFATGLLVSDLTAITMGFFSVYYFRFHGYHFIPFLPSPSEVPLISVYLKTIPFVWLILSLCFLAGGLYGESLSFKKIVRVGSIIKQVFYGIILLIVISAFYRVTSFSRIFIILLFPAFSLFSISGRWILINLEFQIRKMQGKIRSLIIVGEGTLASNLVNNFQSKQFPDYKVAGVVLLNDDMLLPGSVGDVNVLGCFQDMESILDKYVPDEIIFSTLNMDHEQLMAVIASCDRRMIQFFIVPDILNFLTSKVELTVVGGINLLGLQKFPLDNGLKRLSKRIIDIIVSVVMLVGLSWLFLLLYLLVKFSSKGPGFFKQQRCLEDGKEFSMYKFRTMKVSAENKSGPVWAKENDERCTKLGAFMRSKNLDELPQLINVLLGDMSLVGPRPERPHFIKKFKFDIPRYMARHSIKPGITGWAQVSGLRGNTSLEERVKYDLYYIENWSIWFDLKILFFTIFSFKNAY